MSTLIKDSENIKRLNIKLKGIEYDKICIFRGIGYNFEPSEIGAAFGLIQLQNFLSFQILEIKIFILHRNFLINFKNLFILPKILKGVFTKFFSLSNYIKKNNQFSRKIYSYTWRIVKFKQGLYFQEIY